MIAVLASLLAACVPLTEADRFGYIRFDERLGDDDPRFAPAVCDEDGCTGHDRSGVEYRTDGEWITNKTVHGPGPSSAFEDRLEPEEPGSRVLTAVVCPWGSGMWLRLDLTAADRPVYGLYAQP
ncbi:MAG: hypothetical protein IR159_07175 [Brevundimonas sp.]|nr:hypothetical protein [Brevundimonas sp.]